MSAPMIHIRRFTGAIVFFVLAALGPQSVFAANNSQHKLDRALLAAVQAKSVKPQPVIIRAKAGQLEAVRTWLKAHGDIVESEHPALNALSTKATADHLAQLADLLETDTLSYNAPVTGFAAKTPAPTGPPALTALRSTLGLTSTSPTGKGIGVAIIDTGVESSADFQGRFTAFYDFVNNGGRFTTAYDDNGHGTHPVSYTHLRAHEPPEH